jgi:hypothetical protein
MMIDLLSIEDQVDRCRAVSLNNQAAPGIAQSKRRSPGGIEIPARTCITPAYVPSRTRPLVFD